MPIGLTMPFAVNTSSLGLLAYSSTELEATYYNLKALILTNWGERPNHYDLGCNLIEFVFSPMDEETRERINQRVRNQVATWLPYVTLNSVKTILDDQHKIAVQVDFSLRGRQDMSSKLLVVVPLGG